MVERQKVHHKSRRPELFLIVVYMAVLLTFGASFITNRGPQRYYAGSASRFSNQYSSMGRPNLDSCNNNYKQPFILRLFGRQFIISFVQ